MPSVSGWTPRQHANYLLGLASLIGLVILSLISLAPTIDALKYDGWVVLPLLFSIIILGLVVIWNTLIVLLSYLKGPSYIQQAQRIKALWFTIISVVTALAVIVLSGIIWEADELFSDDHPEFDTVLSEQFPQIWLRTASGDYSWPWASGRWVVVGSDMEWLNAVSLAVASPRDNPWPRAEPRLKTQTPSSNPLTTVQIIYDASDEVKAAITDSINRYIEEEYLEPWKHRVMLLRILIAPLLIIAVFGVVLIPRKMWRILEQAEQGSSATEQE